MRLDLCGGMLSRQLACARACKPEVDDGAPISLCIISECLQAGVYLYKEKGGSTVTGTVRIKCHAIYMYHRKCHKLHSVLLVHCRS